MLRAHAVGHQPDRGEVRGLVEPHAVLERQALAVPDLGVDVAEPGSVDQLRGEGLVEVGVAEGVHGGAGRVGWALASVKGNGPDGR
jgi:hypothetical protein